MVGISKLTKKLTYIAAFTWQKHPDRTKTQRFYIYHRVPREILILDPLWLS